MKGAARPSTMTTVLVEVRDGVAWVRLNRPDKRNAMSPALNEAMMEALDQVEADDAAKVMVLSGAGGDFSAGMDLKEYFHALDNARDSTRARARRTALAWQYDRLRMFPKPTIAMVDGCCFGGAFTPLVSCDIAVAAADAVFGLSEVNWGIIPAGVVTRDVAAVMGYRTALFHILTGRTFDGNQAATMGLVTVAVAPGRLRAEVEAIARELMTKNPATLRAAKEAFRLCREMSWEQARDYLYAKLDQMRHLDTDNGRDNALRQFLDKRFRPGHEAYRRSGGHP